MLVSFAVFACPGVYVFYFRYRISGPEPAIPTNFTVKHAADGQVSASWDPPTTSPVPILYYRVEYRSATSGQWTSGAPILANITHTSMLPDNVDNNKIEKYYFRARAYALLAYSDHSEAKILFLPGLLV